MQQQIIEVWHNLPNELKLVLLSIIPLAKTTFAIPTGIAIYKFSIAKTVFFCCLGSILKTPVYYYIIYGGANMLLKTRVRKKIEIVLEKAKKYHSRKFEIFGGFALVLISGSPFMFNGILPALATGYIFGIKPLNNLIYVFIGVIGSALISAFLTKGAIYIY